MVFRTPPGWRDVTIFTSIAPIPEHAPRLACRVTKEPRLGLDLDAHVFQALIRLARETRGIDLRETRPMAVAGRKAVLVRHLVVDREGTELEQRLVFIEAPHPSVPEVMVINVSGHSAESTAIQQASDAVLQSVQFLEPGAAGSAERSSPESHVAEQPPSPGAAETSAFHDAFPMPGSKRGGR